MRLAVHLPNQQQVVEESAMIMLLQNLMLFQKACAMGCITRLILTKLQRNDIEAEMIESSSKETFLIPRIPLIQSDNNIPFSFKRKQFPVDFAFSMTLINPKAKLPIKCA
ncbi:hypothetical protein AVEN_82329-1 [Araneus ventricosus]|uniref:Uncharacterized protein n=1 Tax=Araneus ventricosus TaxID=182803 RepID=A0A4Y2IUX7_ARAVE|nr:hypothetical protein AVEN_82329-1 [Araneus ventricosus]